jgi:hypothetical protein
VRLREHNSTRRRVQAEDWYDDDGHMFLGHGWRWFIKMYSLAEGHILAFSYFAGNHELVVKIYGGKLTRRLYDDSDGEDSSSDDDDSSDGDDSSSSLREVKEEDID